MRESFIEKARQYQSRTVDEVCEYIEHIYVCMSVGFLGGDFKGRL